MEAGTLVLLHSPLVGVESWGSLPEALTRGGVEAVAVPVGGDDRPPFAGRYVEGAVGGALGAGPRGWGGGAAPAARSPGATWRGPWPGRLGRRPGTGRWCWSATAGPGRCWGRSGPGWRPGSGRGGATCSWTPGGPGAGARA